MQVSYKKVSQKKLFFSIFIISFTKKETINNNNNNNNNNNKNNLHILFFLSMWFYFNPQNGVKTQSYGFVWACITSHHYQRIKSQWGI